MGAVFLETDRVDDDSGDYCARHHGCWSGGAGQPWLLPIRVRPVLHQPVWDCPYSFVDPLFTCHARPHHHQQQVSRTLCDGALSHRESCNGTVGIGRLPVPLRPGSQLYLFRHEPVRPLRQTTVLVRVLLGSCGNIARHCEQSAVGTRYRSNLGGPQKVVRGTLVAAISRGNGSVPASVYRSRWIHFLQHPYSESISKYLRNRRGTRTIREEIPAIQSPTGTANYRYFGARRPLPRAGIRTNARHHHSGEQDECIHGEDCIDRLARGPSAPSHATTRNPKAQLGRRPNGHTGRP